MATQWGRKETVVWPPHSPIYTYGAVLMALVCTGAFLWAAFAAQTPLQQIYTPAYLKSAVAGQFKKQDKYRLLYIGNGKNQSRIATTADVAEGSTPTPEGKVLPIARSPRPHSPRGSTLFIAGRKRSTRTSPCTAISRALSSRDTDSRTFTETSFGMASWRSARCFHSPSSAT